MAKRAAAPVRLLRIAVRYWASRPGEIDAEIGAVNNPAAGRSRVSLTGTGRLYRTGGIY
ncbi:MAG TPA: hypothetical protein VKV80_19445 [Streptosporangiaceae bacterium]|nr:hypothetical protein [Streptosporangiaceae bacterium]